MKKWIVLLLVVCAGLFVFHKSILLASCRFVLYRMNSSLQGREITYQKIGWEGKKIVIRDLAIREQGQEILADEIGFDFAVDWRHFRFSPHIEILHPQILIQDQKKGSDAFIFYRSKRLAPVLCVKNGVLQVHEHRFYFSFLPNEKIDSLGSLIVIANLDEDKEPLVKADFFEKKGDLFVEFEMKEKELYRSYPLISAFIPGIDALTGSVDIEGSLTVGQQGGLKELTLLSNVQTLSCSLPSFDLGIEKVDGKVELFFLPDSQGGIQLMLQVAGDLRQGQVVLPTEISAAGSSTQEGICSLAGHVHMEHPDRTKGLSTFQCVWDGQETYTLGLQAEHWTAIELNPLFKHLGIKHECVKGALDGAFTILFSPRGLQKIEVKDLKGNDLQFYDEKNSFVAFHTLAMEGIVDLQKADWLEQCKLQAKGGEWVDSHLHLSDVSLEIAKDEHGFSPSFLQGHWQEIDFVLSFLGKEAESPWNLMAKGVLPGSYQSKIPFEVQVKSAQAGEEIHSVYEGLLFSDPFVASSVFSLPSFSLYDLLMGRVSLPCFEKGSVQLHSCNLSSYQSLFQEFFPEVALQGNIHLQASLTSDQIEVEFTGNSLRMQGHGMSCFLPQVAKSFCRYDIQKSLFSYEIPLRHFAIDLPASSISLQDLQADLKGSFSLVGGGQGRHQGTLSHLSVPLSNDLSLYQGRMEWDFAAGEFFVTRGEGKWGFAGGKEFGWEIKKFFWNLGEKEQGEFCVRILEDTRETAFFDGVIQRKTPDSWECVFQKEKTHLAGILLQAEPLIISQQGISSCEIRPTVHLEKLSPLTSWIESMGFFPDRDLTDAISSFKVKGKMQVGISWQKGKNEWKVMALSPAVSLQNSESYPFRLESRIVQGAWCLDVLHIGSVAIQAELSFLSSGKIQVSCSEGAWEKISWQGKGDVNIEGKKAVCSIPLMQCTFNEETLKGESAISLHCTVDFSKDGKSLVTGDTHFISQLTAPFSCALSTPRKIHFSYGLKEGLICEEIHLIGKELGSSSYLGEWRTKGLAWLPVGGLSCNGMELVLTKKATSKFMETTLSSLSWDGDLKVKGDFKWQKNGYGFQGSLEPGWYGWQGHKLFLEQVQLSIDPQGAIIKTRTHIQEQPVWSSFQLRFGKEMYGVLKILDHPQEKGLQITFRTSLQCTSIESIEGSCFGLESHLKNEKKKKHLATSVLTGEVMCDMKRLQLLFPSSIQEKLAKWKLGSGYSWQGELLLFAEGKQSYAFSGTLQGNNFAFLGYEFKEMKGLLEGNQEKISLSNFQIKEGSAMITAPLCSMKKEKEDWAIQIPSIEVQKLQPSLLKRIDGVAGAYKPFVVRHFFLKNVQGLLNEPKSWKGEGSLAFLNQSKKESSLFDFPLEMIKKLGLDLGVVTPVEGEFTLQLAGEKLYFLSLDRSFSEAKRSEFYLAPSQEPSYVDFSGNLHIDLRMHQNALFKVVEPFTLTVRGTLEKPRYGLSL